MNLSKICAYFGVKGDIVEIKQLNNGHINGTYKLTTEFDGEALFYIVQRINKYVFVDPAALMENLRRITVYMKRKYYEMGIDPSRLVLDFLPRGEAPCCFLDDDGEYWRCYRFVDNSVTFDLPDTDGLMKSIGGAFGNFHSLLSGFDASSLSVTIPNFHYTTGRLNELYEAIRSDPFGRVSAVGDNMKYYFGCFERATVLDRAALPLRVTHNDAKCNNVLFDEKTNDALAIIDLDTVMPGLAAHDFGDAVRSACNSKREDEPDFGSVSLDMKKFRIFTEGYMSKASGFLTTAEKQSLATGVYVLAVELSARFLTDYILGDRYFAKDYGNHNLIRALSQLALAKDVEKHLPEMNDIIEGNG